MPRVIFKNYLMHSVFYPYYITDSIWSTATYGIAAINGAGASSMDAERRHYKLILRDNDLMTYLACVAEREQRR